MERKEKLIDKAVSNRTHQRSVWSRLSPAERLHRSWSLRRLLKDKKSIHDKKFFLTLNKSDIRYMLISGQATVLYGAATFSEDIDLWVSPEPENWQKFIQTLRKIGAKVYKATPPLKTEFVQKGHGFNFEFSATKKEPDWFLDVMGVVPRVNTFQKTWQNVEFYNTEWGRIPVIGLRDLVEIKKTRRLAD